MHERSPVRGSGQHPAPHTAALQCSACASSPALCPSTSSQLEMGSQEALICISLLVTEVEQLARDPLAISMSSLEKYLSESIK